MAHRKHSGLQGENCLTCQRCLKNYWSHWLPGVNVMIETYCMKSHGAVNPKRHCGCPDHTKFIPMTEAELDLIKQGQETEEHCKKLRLSCGGSVRHTPSKKLTAMAVLNAAMELSAPKETREFIIRPLPGMIHNKGDDKVPEAFERKQKVEAAHEG